MAEYAYKMFRKDLTCTRGKGIYQYEPGKWYEEGEANCARNGYHSAKNPLDCFFYYPDWDDSQMWLVEIGGDVDEDSVDSKVSSTRIKLVRRMELKEMVILAMSYIVKHPEEKRRSGNVVEGPGETDGNHYVISTGCKAKGKGRVGDVIGLMDLGKPIRAAVVEIDGRTHLPDVWYSLDELYRKEGAC